MKFVVVVRCSPGENRFNCVQFTALSLEIFNSYFVSIEMVYGPLPIYRVFKQNTQKANLFLPLVLASYNRPCSSIVEGTYKRKIVISYNQVLEQR